MDSIICLRETYTLTPSIDSFTDSISYSWQDGSSDSMLTVSQGGLYWLEAGNACGVSRDSVSITTQDCYCQIFVPTAFTPNADQTNDYFHLVSSCKIQDFSFELYNRWGESMYRSENVDRSWGGTYKSAPCPEGVYVW